MHAQNSLLFSTLSSGDIFFCRNFSRESAAQQDELTSKRNKMIQTLDTYGLIYPTTKSWLMQSKYDRERSRKWAEQPKNDRSNYTREIVRRSRNTRHRLKMDCTEIEYFSYSLRFTFLQSPHANTRLNFSFIFTRTRIGWCGAVVFTLISKTRNLRREMMSDEKIKTRVAFCTIFG